MKIFEGKSPGERNKIIAAIVIGALAVLSLGNLFFGSSSGRKTTVAVQTAPASPRPAASPRGGDAVVGLPSREATDFEYESTELFYTPRSYDAPPAGRNIFAFYEPPPPTPWVPTPTPMPVVKTPVPTPTPPQMIVAVMPQSVFAGSKGFRLEINGDQFTPETRIYFNQNEMPTTFVSGQKLATDIPANFISNEGVRMIMVRTPDGRLYSNQTSINVMAPPKPNFTYLGPLVRKRSNNDTAYIQEQGTQNSVGRRLNDIIGGRFRLVSISATQVIVEDVSLGFRHTVDIAGPPPATAVAPAPQVRQPQTGFPQDGNFIPYNPNMPNNPNSNPQQIPGIPANVPRYVPPNSNRPAQPAQPRQDRKDVDDDDDTDGDE
jgi:hypothetical protein